MVKCTILALEPVFQARAVHTISGEEQDLDEVIRFNETIDQAVAEVTRRFADKATRVTAIVLSASSPMTCAAR
jgi:hypothetical protein